MVEHHLERRRRGIGRKRCRLSCNRLRPATKALELRHPGPEPRHSGSAGLQPRHWSLAHRHPGLAAKFWGFVSKVELAGKLTHRHTCLAGNACLHTGK